MTLYDSDCLIDSFGPHIALRVGIMSLSLNSGKTRKKAVWGRSLLIAIFLGALASLPGSAHAGPGGKAKAPKTPHAKLDHALNQVADGIGESDVIVEFFDDSDSANRIKANGGQSGRKLGILKARTARISNLLLKRLADDPKVKSIHLDREVKGEIARTTMAVGAKNVQA